jgi:hypothetical protein
MERHHHGDEIVIVAPNRIWLADITYVETDQAGFIWPRSWTLQSQDRRLGDGGSFARRATIGGLSDGHCDTAAWHRPNPPFRSWRSICFGGVS